MKYRMSRRWIIIIGLLLVAGLSPAKFAAGQPSAQLEILGQVVFSRADEAGQYQVFVIDLATNQTTQLTDDTTGHSFFPHWSPDGQFIAYLFATGDLSDAENIQRQLMVMKADGSDPIALTDGSFGFVVIPTEWSPDSQYILFRSYHAEREKPVGDFYVVKRDGTALTPLGVGDSRVLQGGWTADNRVVVEENDALQFFAPDGTREETTLPLDEDFTMVFQPNPSGEAFVFQELEANADGRQYWLGMLDLASGTAERSVALPTDNALINSMQWSPTETHVALSVLVTDGGNTQWQLYVLAVTSGTRQLIENGDTGAYAWSPDGQVLAYGTIPPDDGPLMIYGYEVATGESFPITEGSQPDWH